MPMLTKTLFAAAVVAFATPGAYVGDDVALAPQGFTVAAFATVPPAPWAPQDGADQTYRRGREALMKNDFRAAANLFAEIGRKWPKSTYAADALYWRAFALNRLGGESSLREARAALETMLKSYPQAKAVADARALAASIDGQLARSGDENAAARTSERARKTGCPANDEDSDVRIAALNAVMQMDAQRALPILKAVLARRDECSETLRRKAVFVLSQQSSSEAADLLVGVAKNDPSHDVREQAVFWLGQVNDPRALAFLSDIANGSGDEELRSKAVFALMQQDSDKAHALVRQLAERNDVPVRVREQAVFWIGQHASAANAQWLRALFGRVPAADQEMKKKILFSLSQMSGQGNDRWLMSVAADASQPVEIRKHAIWTAGQAGVSSAELVAVYDRSSEREMKEHVIWVLSQDDDKAATDKLFDIARRDPDMQMRKKALFWLGQKDDPRVQQLLLEILNKP